MKIAHLMAGASGGGAELFFERLCIAMHGTGDDVLPVIRRDAARAARLQAAGLATCELPYGGMFDWTTGRALRRALHDFGPRAVVAWMNRAARFAPQGDWPLVGRLGGYYDLEYYRRCDHLVGNTRTLTNWIIAQGWPQARVQYVPNFVPDLLGATPDRLGAPAGARLIAATGRLHRNKGFDVLIRALRHVPGAVLVIAGEGPERDALTRLAQTEDVAQRVLLPGWVADTAGLLAACDVFVSSSRLEPLGNVVLEAWSAARPVVCTASDGPRELIGSGAVGGPVGGQTGLLTPLEDAKALADALNTVLDSPDLAAQLARQGRAAWNAEYAQAHVVSQWRDFLMNVEKA